MSYKKRFLIIALVLFAACDAAAWYATYRTVRRPSLTQVQAQAAQAVEAANRELPVTQTRDAFDARVSLNGEWLYRQTGSEMGKFFDPALNTGGWHKMTLPTNWYVAGLNYQGVIWFRREFTPDDGWKGRLVRLGFGGVDYYADVWLNGKHLGRHQGYFEPFTYNISDLVKFGQKNVLVVRVDSPYEEYDKVFPGRKTLIKGILEHGPSRPGSPWQESGESANTGGIWSDVWLQASSFLTVDQVQLQAVWEKPLAESNTPRFKAQVTLTNHSDQPAHVKASLVLTPKNFKGAEIRLPAVDSTLKPGTGALEITGQVSDPSLWWPWDRGLPNLYQAHLQVTMDNQAVADKTVDFGFREVKVSPDSWAWTVNGQRYFPRGTNYISSIWLSQSTPERLAQDIRLMREANLNFIRLPAHVEPEAFYQAADEAGMLVWQDFPLQWGYTDAPAFVDEAQRQMRVMVQLLYNHPSIALWCAHNESPWLSAEIRNRAPSPDSRQNKQMDGLLQQVGKKLDPTRYTHLTSGAGDNHVYAGWDSGSWTDYYDLPGAPLVSEYGAGSLPDLKMMQKIFLPQELVYASGEVDERWSYQGFQSRQLFNVAKLEYQKPEKDTDPLPSLEKLIQDSQVYQANLLKYATEAYRREKYTKVQGIFQYLFSDPWPSIGLSVMDNDRQPKPAYAALQTAMQPILPSIYASTPDGLDGEYWTYKRINRMGIGLHVVNDTPLAYPQASLRFMIQREDGTPVKEDVTPVDIGADSARIYRLLSNLDLPAGKYQIQVRLTDAQGKLLGQNALKFEALPKDVPTAMPTTQANP